MQKILISPDLILLSLIFSVSFLVGVVRFFYTEALYSRVTLYSVTFYLLSYFSLNLLFPIYSFTFFETVGGELMILNLLTIFLAFGFLATHGIIPKLSHLSAVILLFLISGCLFPYLYYCVQFGLFAELKLIDQGKTSYLFLTSGTMVWFFEIFFRQERPAEKKVNPFDGNFLLFLGLPLSLLIGFGNHESGEIYSFLPKLILSFFALLLGMFSVLRYTEMKKGSILLAILASLNLVFVTLEISVFLLVPISYVLGIFIPFLLEWLVKRDWSEHGIVLLLSCLVTTVLALFLSILFLPNTDWPHSPLVMLGVQSLYLLSIFLISIFIAASVYFLPKKAEE